jgi:mRNA-degrading endonuclease RelE of RelBE toxin-antitoxin system
MSYKILALSQFEKELKRLVKKYPSLREEIIQLKETLIKDPLSGAPLGNNIFKIRLAVASKGKGKRGGMRLITFVKIISETIYLVSIYDKSEMENISDRDIKERLKEII